MALYRCGSSSDLEIEVGGDDWSKALGMTIYGRGSWSATYQGDGSGSITSDGTGQGKTTISNNLTHFTKVRITNISSDQPFNDEQVGGRVSRIWVNGVQVTGNGHVINLGSAPSTITIEVYSTGDTLGGSGGSRNCSCYAQFL